MTTPKTTTPQTPKPESRTWKPIIAGILIILAGITAIVAEIIHLSSGGLGIFAGVPFVESSASLGGGLFASGVIAIVGGIFTLLRKVWWLAVVGVIFSMFFAIWPILVIGLIAIILIATSRREFKRTKIG